MADEAAAVVTSVVAQTLGIVLPAEMEGDYWPGLILGINACVGTVWWILSWFIYVKNRKDDSKLLTMELTETLPIGFFWARIVEFGGEYTYLGLSLFFTFLSSIIVSVAEMITWALYMTGEMAFFGWYVNIIGYYGSIVFYVMPPVFSLLYITVTLKGRVDQNPGAYAVWLTIIGTAMWLLNSFLHIYFAERLAAHIAKTVPYVEPVYKVMKTVAKRRRINCKIPRGSMTEEQYRIACEAIAKADKAKAAFDEGRRAEEGEPAAAPAEEAADASEEAADEAF